MTDITHKFEEGQKIWYRGSFGRGKLELVTIESAEDYKNEEPVYDLSNGHWCYEAQIESEEII